MSKTTTNYGLIKPELTDAADITLYNENWDKIDTELTPVKYGDYIGNGNYGSANANTLTFDFKPKIVVVVCEESNQKGIFIQGASKAHTTVSDGTMNQTCNLVWSSNSVSWYCNKDGTYVTATGIQLNVINYHYSYIAIG